MKTSSLPARTRVSGSLRRLFPGVLAAVLAASLSAHASASASTAPAVSAPAKQLAQPVEIPFNRRLFGVHDYHMSSLTRHATGSIRLWDSGTSWPDIEPHRHQFDFSRLDQMVEAAHQNGTEVTLVFAMTPQFAAPNPDHSSYATEMPRLGAYRELVRTVMKRYRDFFGPGVPGIANYQVWNEANIDTFWTGTPAEMATLTRAVWQVRNRVDPGARVIAPALETRMAYQRAWLRRFYAERVGGRPVWSYVDAVSLNLYPLDSYDGRPGTPEDSMALLEKSRRLLARDGAPSTLPVWDTEVNYGLLAGAPGGTPAVQIPSTVQAAYVMRTYLLNEARGVQRVFWYAYDMGNLPPSRGGKPLANTLLTSPADRTTLTPAGLAFDRVRAWMHGTMVAPPGKQPCPVDGKGTYTCTIQYASGTVGRIYWNPYRSVRIPLSTSVRSRVNELGVVTRLAGVRHMKVGLTPVLVRSRG